MIQRVRIEGGYDVRMAESNGYRWLIYAMLGALFAAIVSVLNKRALNKADLVAALLVQAGLALATMAILYFTVKRTSQEATPSWAWLLLGLSGVATGLSWYFGYHALQLTTVGKSTPIDKLSLPLAVVFAMIFLAERPSAINWVGIGLMLVGAIFVARG